ncbi:MAG TPA: DUF4476 domain-containing protein [Segetibacter sp.]|nr:DUF4476 domain-containing protein [Segetibacter sp.]
MKYFLSIFFLFFCLNFLSAQDRHFVFIQSDTKQPFYVSVNGKLYSSTASGYVIIPKLEDGNYNLTIGFAQNAFPEQTFSIPVQNKDLGFGLKNFNEKGWGLFNLQSLDITMASAGNTNVVAKALSETSNANAPAPVISFEKKKDTTQLATKSTATTTLAKEDASKDTPTKVEQPLAATAKSTDNPQTSTLSAKDDVAAVRTERPLDVKKVSEVVGEEGVHLSYVERSGKSNDTINIIIPSSPATGESKTSAPSGATKRNTSSDEQATTTAVSVAANASSTESHSDLKFLDINMNSKKDSTSTPVAPAGESRIMENSNCKNVATDEDYANLRKKMSRETTDDKMISEAKKFYRNKCFTTSQIKGLSTLFLSDEGRFKFFDASFVSVADAAQYATLQSEFIDPAFVARFRSLIQ